MDLNVSPQPEEDDDYFEQRIEDDRAPQHVGHVEHIESAVEIARREREERRRKLKRERIDDRPTHAPKHANYDNSYQKNFRSYDRSKLPPGWLDCPPMGQDIYGIIPSKVPLGEHFFDSIPPGKRYSFKQVFNKVRVLGKRIGLVIDLTNTSRYYSVSDWKKDGIKHVKIQCKGRDSVPDNESVNLFVYEVSQFLSRQKLQSMRHIFVHCTHGHNRTGFMIVHYLVRMLSFSVTQAVKTFADARPPGIYKPDYIEALYTFYHENRPEMIVCPQTPEWKRSSDLDLNGEAVPDDDDVGDSMAPVQENIEISTVMTNDDVLGDSIPYDQQDAMRHFCYQALKLAIGPKGNSQFPGSHPVSLNRDNLQLLRQRYYYATWKADGTRYMMLITLDGCYLIDRNFNFRRVQMRFLCRCSNEALAEKTHHYTLLDGEMIIDTVPDSQKQERRYLIYDLMAINNRSVVELPFSERWRLLEKDIIEPRNHERQLICQSRNPRKDCYYRYDLEPFRVRRKDFWPLSTVNKLLREFIPKLSHEADGLIFQGWDDPYVPRTHEGLLKWKYANMNSVDFLFEMVDGRQLLFCFEKGRKKLVEGNKVQFNDDSDPSSYTGKIIECSWGFDENVWVFMRIRSDKTTPNDFNTYKKVLRSIRDNITEDVLMIEINEIIGLPMYVERLKQLTYKANVPRRA